MWKTYSKYLLRYIFYFFEMIPLVAFGKKKITAVLKGRSGLKEGFKWPVEVPCGVKNFSLILFFITCKKHQGEELTSYKD